MSRKTDRSDSPSRPTRPSRRWESQLAAVGLAVMAAITFANVAIRYLTNQSFAWTEEVSVALMVIVTLLGAGAAIADRAHVRIEFFAEAGSPLRRLALALVASLATVAVFATLAVLGARMAWDDFRFEVTSPGIGVPQWWYTCWLPVLAAAIAVRALQALRRTWRRRRAALARG